MKAANREQKNVHHDEENPVNWGKEEVDSWLQLMWPQLTPRNPLSQLSGWQLLRLTRAQLVEVCGHQVAREDAIQVHLTFWQLYLEARAVASARTEHARPKFHTGVGGPWSMVTNLTSQEPVQRKSYTEIMNGDGEEEKVNVALGTSKRNFEERLNEGFKGNIPRYQRKNEEMMKMEWANKVSPEAVPFFTVFLT